MAIVLWTWCFDGGDNGTLRLMIGATLVVTAPMAMVYLMAIVARWLWRLSGDGTLMAMLLSLVSGSWRCRGHKLKQESTHSYFE